MYMMRLQLMAIEILEDHVVYVDREARGDRDELLSIRYGQLPYDELIERAERLEARAEELYVTSTLRNEPNRAAIDKWLVDMTDRYLRKYG